MKKLIIISTIIFSLMFSTASFARWTNIIRNHDGTTFYLDVLKIAKNDRYVYFWELIDYLKPTKNGILSHKVFAQADCKIIKKRIISFSSYKKPMGVGNSLPYEPKNLKWMQPAPSSSMETVVKSACALAR